MTSPQLWFHARRAGSHVRTFVPLTVFALALVGVAIGGIAQGRDAPESESSIAVYGPPPPPGPAADVSVSDAYVAALKRAAETRLVALGLDRVPVADPVAAPRVVGPNVPEMVTTIPSVLENDLGSRTQDVGVAVVTVPPTKIPVPVPVERRPPESAVAPVPQVSPYAPVVVAQASYDPYLNGVWPQRLDRVNAQTKREETGKLPGSFAFWQVVQMQAVLSGHAAPLPPKPVGN